MLTVLVKYTSPKQHLISISNSGTSGIISTKRRINGTLGNKAGITQLQTAIITYLKTKKPLAEHTVVVNFGSPFFKGSGFISKYYVRKTALTFFH